LLNGHDLDHLVGYRLHPNQVAIGFRLLARNLAIGVQIQAAGARPDVIREPRAFRARQVEGLGTFRLSPEAIELRPLHPQAPTEWCYRGPAAPFVWSPDTQLSDLR
jgi:hypothetical protein